MIELPCQSTKGFVLSDAEAAALRTKDPRSTGVLHPYIIGDELLHTGRPGRWVVDIDAPDATAAKAESPGAYDRLRHLVLPDRERRAKEEDEGNAEALAANPKARVNWHHRNFLARWWQHSYRRDDLLAAIASLDRFIIISRVASENRRPVFVFASTAIRAGDALQCFALDDDYSFGVLHSTAHELWFRGRCSHLKSDLRYTARTVFNTFPWPQDPSKAQVAAVVEAVDEVLQVRQARLRVGLSLAQIYDSLNEPGTNALRDAHDHLDAAVAKAYGFNPKADLLTQLLELNQTCAGREKAGETVRGAGPAGLAGTRVTDFMVPPLKLV